MSTEMQRGLILISLKGQYPGMLMEKKLRQELGPFYEDSGLLKGDLQYLVDDGLIRCEERVLAKHRIRQYKSTPKGIRVAEGSESNAGVHIELAG